MIVGKWRVPENPQLEYLMRALSFVCALSMIQACGNLAPRSFGSLGGREVSHPPVEGSILHSIQDLQAKPYRDACDKRFAAPQLNLAHALDLGAERIKAAAAARGDTGVYRRVSVGPILVRELVNPMDDLQPGWQQRSYGWQELLDAFVQMRSRATTGDWIWVDSMARSLLVEDRGRLQSLNNVYLRREDFPLVQSALGKLKSCYAGGGCYNPDLTAAEAALISNNRYYRQFDLTYAEDWQELIKWMEDDLSYVKIYANHTIRRDADGTIYLPLDPGEFASVKEALAKYIEEVWRSDERRLKIEWTTREQNPDAFKFVLEPGFGGRAYVTYKDRLIHLYTDVRAGSIAHEIGHVLGLPDTYFTTYSPNSCDYLIEDSEEDLMSNSNGRVLPVHWQTLDTIYPTNDAK
jgi:hypothetical protein